MKFYAEKLLKPAAKAGIMKLKDRVFKIFLNTIPVIVMVALIPVLSNDYALTGAYLAIIAAALLIRYEKRDILFFSFGLVTMTIAEYLFISTGVETFRRNSLFGLMPLWLPILWAYAFVAMKRAIIILCK